MYKVFIADDEVVVRQAVRNNIAWEKNGFTLAGEAGDGEMALAIIQDVKTDILITDVRMPFLNGLELARIVRSTMPWIKIIILSGHDEFAYAQKAISIGVTDYLLKPVNCSDIQMILDKTALNIEKERQATLQMAKLEASAQSAVSAETTIYIQNLMQSDFSTTEAFSRAQVLGLDIAARKYNVILAEISASRDHYDRLYTAKVLIERLINSSPDVLGAFWGNDRVALLVKGDNDDQIEERVYELVQAITHEAVESAKCKVTIGVGATVDRLSELRHAYMQADLSRKQQLEQSIEKFMVTEPLNIGHLIANESLDKMLRHALPQDIPAILLPFLSNIESGDMQSAVMRNCIAMELLLSCARLISSLKGVPSEVVPELRDYTYCVSRMNTRQGFEKIATDVLTHTIDFREQNSDDKYSAIIKKARAYIEENYMNTDASLHSVASVVHLSPNHFSMVFSQRTGLTFMETLTQTRIAKAKALIEQTNLLLGDIALRVGYNEAHYFSYIFKRNVGISPREYRQQFENDNAAPP